MGIQIIKATDLISKKNTYEVSESSKNTVNNNDDEDDDEDLLNFIKQNKDSIEKPPKITTR